MKTIDFYSEGKWDKGSRERLLQREKIVLRLLQPHLKKGKRVLDVGCGAGRFLYQLNKRVQNMELHGIDYSQVRIKKASTLPFKFKKANIEAGLPYEDNYFNIVYAGEVLEHLYNPDAFIIEAKRILKKGGLLLLTTPNLCAWFNRIFMLFGIQPLFIESSTKSNKTGAGILKKFKGPDPVGHLRIYNKTAIKDILKANGFEIIRIKGAIFESLPFPLKSIDYIFSKFTGLSSGMIVLARNYLNKRRLKAR